MSNRVLWVLVLIWVFAFWYLLYIYFFVSYTWVLKINSNTHNFHVKLFAVKLWKSFNYECKTNPCILEKISPLEYNYTISKTNYKTISWKIIINSKKENILSINQELDTNLIKVEDKAEKVSNSDVIKELRLQKDTIWFTKIEKLWYFYFKTDNWKLVLFSFNNETEKKLWEFNFVDSSLVKINQIYWKNDVIFIELWDDKFLYYLNSYESKKVDLRIPINYIKVWKSKNEYIISTQKWLFLYNEQKDFLEYFYLFKDFVFKDDHYIWVIWKEEKQKFINFNLKDNWKNLIIIYSTKDLDRKIILETDLQIDKIILENNKIYFFNNNDKYELMNY